MQKTTASEKRYQLSVTRGEIEAIIGALRVDLDEYSYHEIDPVEDMNHQASLQHERELLALLEERLKKIDETGE